MIKAIFFDFDGVLTLDEHGSDTECRNLQLETGVDFQKICLCHEMYWGDKILLDTVTHEDLWDDFCACLCAKLDIAILPRVLGNVPKNENMFGLAKELKQRKYKLGIITNNDDKRMTILEQELGLQKLFDSIIVSGRVGIKKPDHDIFEKAVESLNLQPQECLFIDNTVKNLVAAKQLGFETYYHLCGKNDINALKKHLLLHGVLVG